MASGAASIPVLRGQVDRVHGHTRTLAAEARAVHPVAAIQATHLKNEWENKLYLVERVHGRAAAWEKRMDRSILSTVRRLPGLASAHVGLDTVLGRDEKLGFEDVLGLPEFRPEMPRYSVHEAVERGVHM